MKILPKLQYFTLLLAFSFFISFTPQNIAFADNGLENKTKGNTFHIKKKGEGTKAKGTVKKGKKKKRDNDGKLSGGTGKGDCGFYVTTLDGDTNTQQNGDAQSKYEACCDDASVQTAEQFAHCMGKKYFDQYDTNRVSTGNTNNNTAANNLN